MQLPSINMPKWIVAATKLKGEGYNRIILLGRHPLAEIYSNDCKGMNSDFVWLKERRCIFAALEEFERACLLIIFGRDGAAYLRENSSELKDKLHGLPIVEVFDNSWPETNEPFEIKTTPVRIYYDEISHKLLQEMEAKILECYPNSAFVRKARIQ
ncbi:hypothetical protein [Methylorubrum extorquens]